MNWLKKIIKYVPLTNKSLRVLVLEVLDTRKNLTQQSLLEILERKTKRKIPIKKLILLLQVLEITGVLRVKRLNNNKYYEKK